MIAASSLRGCRVLLASALLVAVLGALNKRYVFADREGFVLLIPIHVGALLTVLTIMTVMGVTNHMGWEMFPRWLVHSLLGNWLITASHHERHHEEYRCNYGLYFRVWDRWCGTDKGLSKRIVAEAGHGAQVPVR